MPHPLTITLFTKYKVLFLYLLKYCLYRKKSLYHTYFYLIFQIRKNIYCSLKI